MVRARLERIVYPAVRDLQLAPKTTDTPPANCYTLDADRKNWLAQGKSFTLFPTERTYSSTPKPISDADFYATDQGSKMSLAHRAQRSPYRYVSMRTQSAGRATYVPGNEAPTTSDLVAPTSYGARYGILERTMPRASPGGSAFASGALRGGPGKSDAAEPGYATLSMDTRTWQGKGASFEKAQRWPRPPGPGSNRVSDRPNPGPGTYGKLHNYPDKGFRGSGRGFNHNRSIG